MKKKVGEVGETDKNKAESEEDKTISAVVPAAAAATADRWSAESKGEKEEKR